MMLNIVRRWSFGVAQSTTVTVVVAVVVASLIGWALGNEYWFVVGILLLLCLSPIVLRWPLVSTFGLYAFLVPFDLAASLFAQNAGPTITRFVGVLAAGAMLSGGLVQ